MFCLLVKALIKKEGKLNLRCWMLNVKSTSENFVMISEVALFKLLFKTYQMFCFLKIFF